MNQTLIGGFIKELRKEKNLTQEQLAEHLNVSCRTVSRWETGSNLPDMDILIALAEFFQVELGELLNGKRQIHKGSAEEDTLMMMANFSSQDKIKLAKRMHLLFIGGTAAALLHLILTFTDSADTFLGGMCQGITLGMMLVGTLFTSRYSSKLRTQKIRLLNRVRNINGTSKGHP
ncbi:MAG: helix-turn-helix transcriptional regulator [Clostridia bacterium]|nr:helix-turn-helix transcriptional regulator [Clostridia bacterium]